MFAALADDDRELADSISSKIKVFHALAPVIYTVRFEFWARRGINSELRKVAQCSSSVFPSTHGLWFNSWTNTSAFTLQGSDLRKSPKPPSSKHKSQF
jgi:hypothetical protein